MFLCWFIFHRLILLFKVAAHHGLRGIEPHNNRVSVGEQESNLLNTKNWWAVQDLNLRPKDYESSALTY